jgi:hypothetical protein
MKRAIILAGAAAFAVAGLFAQDAKNGLNRDYWIDFKGGIGNVESNLKNKVAPSGSDVLNSFEAVSWKDGKANPNIADAYGQAVYGFVVPEKSGEYVFWIAADDNGILKLSSDESPANAKPIAKTVIWTAAKEFTKKPEQKSAPVKLEAGKKYYVEALMYEGAGGDNLAVAWTLPGDPQDKPSEVIPGKNLKPLK